MRVSMLLHKSVVNDARVRREAAALADAGYEVTVVHLPRPGSEPPTSTLPYTLTAATLRRGRGRLPRATRLAAEAARLSNRAVAARPDVVHAHDAAMLLPGLAAARRTGARLVYDSHELATGVPYRGRAWAALVASLERLGAPRADRVIAVSDGIAARLEDRYALRAAPVVVRNVPELPPPGEAAPDLRRQLGVGESPLVLHQGSAAAGRGGETLVSATASLPGVHLLFLGIEGRDTERLRGVADASGSGDRTHFLAPVPLEALLSHTAQADVGVSLLEDSCENHRLALPNKLFEYVAAGIPVVVSDLPEMGALVRRRGIGWTADPGRPESVATALRAALAGRDDDLRDRLAEAAAELDWGREKQRLLAAYEGLGDA
jgi:glycosyltransferase involved in cell wall biosynthesis